MHLKIKLSIVLSMSERYIFFTFRPQINDIQLFEDFIILFLPFLKSHKSWCYSIENDGTLHRHIHAVIEGDYKDKDKFYQKWNKTNGLKDFKSHCKAYTNTNENGFDTKLIPDCKNDLYHIIGYTLKESDKTDRSLNNMDKNLITISIDYYHAHRRIKAKDPERKDWTLITNKNVYAHIEEYIDKNEIILPCHNIWTHLTHDRYGLATITEKQCKIAMAQITSCRLKERNAQPHWDSEETIFNYGNAETVTMIDTVGTEMHTTILSDLHTSQKALEKARHRTIQAVQHRLMHLENFEEINQILKDMKNINDIQS